MPALVRLGPSIPVTSYPVTGTIIRYDTWILALPGFDDGDGMGHQDFRDEGSAAIASASAVVDGGQLAGRMASNVMRNPSAPAIFATVAKLGLPSSDRAL